jgi:dipeptidase D
MDVNKITELKPELLWKNFYNLTQIPRPSKKEEKVIQFVREFGEKLKLDVEVDNVGNVVIKKPATAGMENRKGVVLQSHLDMVPQKNSDSSHDFEKDPIQAYIDGEWVTAKGTTLGSDNGIGVSAIMSILESDNIEHGPIEALFTIDEETGMTGAFALKPRNLKGDILLNLDSEDEGELYVGCAGGINANISFAINRENFPANHKAYKISISGLKGGHSGLDINMGRGNSNKVMVRLLWKATREFQIKLSDIEGGNLRNAIPREAYAVVAVPAEKEKDFIEVVKKFAATITSELSGTEPDLKIQASPCDTPKTIIDTDTQINILNALYACPNGVIRMSDAVPGLVETSTNLAVVKSEDNKVVVLCLLRGSVDSAKAGLADRMRGLFELAGAEVGFDGDYPGWKPNMNSAILNTMQEVYDKKFGKKPGILAIHAGLECGIIGGAYPNLDMISFGPTIRFPHSPDEKVNIPSVQKFWDFLIETLRNIPSK